MEHIKSWYFLYILVFVLGMVSCHSDDDPGLSSDQKIEDYLEEQELLDSTMRDDSGIYYQILTENPSGAAPVQGDVIGIYFTADVANGAVIDANENNGTNEPSILHYGLNAVLPIGLDNCLALLRQGEKGVFYIPPTLAYGEDNEVSSAIPAGSVIRIFIEIATIERQSVVLQQQRLDIEQFIIDQNLNDSIWAAIDTVMRPIDSLWVPNINLTYDSVMVPLDSIWYDVVGGEIPVDSVFHFVEYVEYLSSGIYYKRQRAGIPGSSALSGEFNSINYQVYTMDSYPNSPIDAVSQFSFIHNQNSVITGLDAGIAVMEEDERAILILPSNLAYLGSVFVIPKSEMEYFVDQEIIPSYSLKVRPFEVLVFDVTLLPPQN